MKAKDFSFEIKAGWTFEEITLSCAREGLDWILGEISPGKWWSLIHGNVQKMCGLSSWFSGELDLKVFSNLYNSIFLYFPLKR